MPEGLPLFPILLPSVPFEEREALPQASGIYFALSATGEVLYVGASRNLVLRWKQHHRTADLQHLSCATIAYWICDVSQLADTEQAMLGQFRPPLNRLRSPHYAPSAQAKMTTSYRMIRIREQTLRKLKLAASLQPRNTSLLGLLDQLLDAELRRVGMAARDATSGLPGQETL